jgi:hypothetical protein
MLTSIIGRHIVTSVSDIEPSATAHAAVNCSDFIAFVIETQYNIDDD